MASIFAKRQNRFWEPDKFIQPDPERLSRPAEDDNEFKQLLLEASEEFRKAEIIKKSRVLNFIIDEAAALMHLKQLSSEPGSQLAQAKELGRKGLEHWLEEYDRKPEYHERVDFFRRHLDDSDSMDRLAQEILKKYQASLDSFNKLKGVESQ